MKIILICLLLLFSTHSFAEKVLFTSKYNEETTLSIVPSAKRYGKSNIYKADKGEQGLMFFETHKNELHTLALVPNDPYFGSQWAHQNINTQGAWDVTTGVGRVVGICDTGTNPHQDLSILSGFNAVDRGTDFTDNNGHGTATAGTAAAIINNGVGVAGVAGGAQVVAGKVSNLSDGTAYTDALVYCITNMADMGIKVVNLSYNVLGNTGVISAGTYLKGKGGVLVVAGSNTGIEEFPTPSDDVVFVSATNVYDNLTSFSSWGAYIDVAAPGENIYTTSRSGGYTSAYGTSFSSPLVAGVIALIQSVRPELGNKDVQAILFQSAKDVGAVGKDKNFGYGIVNASAAVTLALTYVPIVEPPPPPPPPEEPPKPCVPKGKNGKNCK